MPCRVAAASLAGWAPWPGVAACTCRAAVSAAEGSFPTTCLCPTELPTCRRKVAITPTSAGLTPAPWDCTRPCLRRLLTRSTTTPASIALYQLGASPSRSCSHSSCSHSANGAMAQRYDPLDAGQARGQLTPCLAIHELAEVSKADCCLVSDTQKSCHHLACNMQCISSAHA